MYAGPLTSLLKKWGSKKVALLYTGTEHYDVYFKFNLSPTQNNDEIARHMFRAFRAADQSGADVILISFVENTGLGMAINDRIARAVIRD
jgi:L-threonylcarbamoyladenylate synthase